MKVVPGLEMARKVPKIVFEFGEIFVFPYTLIHINIFDILQ